MSAARRDIRSTGADARMTAPRREPALIAIFGPTAIGKTAVAVALAGSLRTRGHRPVAVAADALQVYAGLERLTGAATPTERAQLEHRLISFLPVEASFSVAQYAPLAHAEIDELLVSGALPIVVGGTGLYLRAALTKLELRPRPAPGVRERLERRLAQLGATALHAELAQQAPWAAAAVDPNDRRRIVRSLELLESGQLEPIPQPSRLWTADTRHPTLLIGLVMDRAALYARVEQRVEAIVRAGAADEVARAEAAGASQTARQALGFSELLAGDVDALRRRTRAYARRQLTWMRKLAGVQMIDMTEHTPEQTAAAIAELWEQRVAG